MVLDGGSVRARRRPSRPLVLLLWPLCLQALLCLHAPVLAQRPANLVILFADDLGYGDLGSYGHPTIRTPALDRMAREGMRFTQFYSAEPVCTPSRAALLTGRLPVRTGMYSDRRRVLFPDSREGIDEGEITLAEALKARGYATACIGKWHLGHLPQSLPTRHGFDRWFGIPYSNDMAAKERGFPPTPLYRDEAVIEAPAVQETLTRRYTEEAVRFIDLNRERPFFLYVPYTFPHVPLHASDRFRGRSERGLYGDVVEELDWSAGRILEALRERGLDRSTFVFFSSDNGPWLTQSQNGGSAGLLREGKGSTWEGGVRVPGIAWWPGHVAAGSVTSELGNAMDLFTTCIRIAGGDPPSDRPIDGVSLLPVLRGAGPSERKVHFYYRGSRLMAVRKGPWKAHLFTQPGYGPEQLAMHDPPLLFHLEHDPSERHDLALRRPGILAELLEEAERHLARTPKARSRLDARLPREF